MCNFGVEVLQQFGTTQKVSKKIIITPPYTVLCPVILCHTSLCPPPPPLSPRQDARQYTLFSITLLRHAHVLNLVLNEEKKLKLNDKYKFVESLNNKMSPLSGTFIYFLQFLRKCKMCLQFFLNFIFFHLQQYYQRSQSLSIF